MNRRQFLKYGMFGLAGGVVSASPVFKIGKAFAAPMFGGGVWKFGVMGDTQWNQHKAGSDGLQDHSLGPVGANPHSVPQSIIDQVEAEMVNHNVQMVIQVGDLSDTGTDRATKYRATLAQNNLMSNGIDFFPQRGNHETYGQRFGDTTYKEWDWGVSSMKAAFPQILGHRSGLVSGSGATNFAFAVDYTGGDCLSYAFDYNNVRFVMLDFWATANKYNAKPCGEHYPVGYTVADQQAWITDQLKNRKVEHAVVMAHQPLMGQDHQDTMFSGYTEANPEWQDAFYKSMNDYNARYFVSGHDHIHQRSIVKSPNGKYAVEQLICQSCSDKFYTPKPLDDKKWYGQKKRETSMSQEMYSVGFYVYTVDGPVMMVDYYADDHANWESSKHYPDGSGSLVTPRFNFVKKETWGYSLTDKGLAAFSIKERGSFTIKTPNTEARIVKKADARDYQGRSFEKEAAAWWEDKSSVKNAESMSDVVTILGATSAAIEQHQNKDNTNNPDDPSCIQLSYAGEGKPVLCTRADDGSWVNAVDTNFGGKKKFVRGSYNGKYPLGTYGYDSRKKVAWAVVNNDGQFAVING